MSCLQFVTCVYQIVSNSIADPTWFHKMIMPYIFSRKKWREHLFLQHYAAMIILHWHYHTLLSCLINFPYLWLRKLVGFTFWMIVFCLFLNYSCILYVNSPCWADTFLGNNQLGSELVSSLLLLWTPDTCFFVVVLSFCRMFPQMIF